MTDDQVEVIAKAIWQGLHEIANAIEGAGCRIAEDTALNFCISGGLERLAQTIEKKRR